MMMKIRMAKPKDLGAINKLTIETIQTHGGTVRLKLSDDDLKDEILNEKSLKGTYLAELNGEVVGYLCFNPDIKVDEWCGKHYEIERIVIKDGYIGQGIGAKLIEAITEKARNEGVKIKVCT